VKNQGKKVLNILRSQVFYNVISLIALIVSFSTLIFTVYNQVKYDKINIILSEGFEKNRMIECVLNEDEAYLNIPVIITITNKSNLVQPVDRIDVEIADTSKNDYEWNEIYEISGNKLYLPVNIPEQSSYAFQINLHLPLEEKTLQEICELYLISNQSGRYELGTINDFEEKINTIKYSESLSLSDILKTVYYINFWMPNSKHDYPVVKYIYMFPK